MGIFSSMKISNKIAAIFFVLLVMMGAGGSVGLYNAVSIVNVTERLYLETFKRMETLSAIEKEFITEEQELFSHIIVADAGSKSFFEASIIGRMKRIGDLSAEYGSYELDETSAGMLAEFTKELGIYWKTQDEILGFSAAKKTSRAMEIAREDGKRNFIATLGALTNLLEKERHSASMAYAESKHLGRIITSVTVFFTIMALFIAGGFWWALTRAIVKPIRILGESATLITHGDFKRRAAVTSGDEIGDLAEKFNKMAGNLEEFYVTLEKKVDERTDELKIANEELYRNKKELEIKNEELEQASRMKSQFLANVSHELRTPLNSIIGFSELLQEKSFGELNDKQLQYVKFVNTSGTHLLQLINSILDLSKIEAGKMELIPERFSLVDLFAEIQGTIRPIAHKRNITIETKETAATPVITADKAKFKQIMFNLLSNAVKFNIEGGRVIVDWDIKEEPVGLAMHKNLYISVEDTGIGIKDVDIKRLFREFEQLDTSVSREHGGTGLGLALTKKLVELHGGEISVQSEPGRGCKFTVKLPQGVSDIELLPLTVSPAVILPQMADKPRILVGSESEDITQLLKIYLEGDSHYEVFTVNDGVELMDAARRKKPFAIVMGIMLPKKDGWEVLKELKHYEETKDIPVVIVSAANHRELGFALGAVDYLVKPVDKAKLLEVLGRLSLTTKVKSAHITILVVDDEPHVLNLLGDMLEREDFRVLKAQNGESAVSLAVEAVPDLMILDLMMPGMSGFDVVERLRDHPIARNIPIIIFTAKDITREDKERLGMNIQKIIQKANFTKEDFLAEVRMLELAYPQKANLIDRSTKLFNRRYFDIVLSRELSRSERYGHVFSILFIDIDDFARFNEINGVAKGDEALQEFSRLLHDNLRKADLPARYGPDEFAVLLPGITDKEAHKVAEKIRTHVELYHFPSRKDSSDSLTVTIAVAAVPTLIKTNIMACLENSTKKAHAAGGNRISSAAVES